MSKKKHNPIAPLFKDLVFNPKFESLTLQELMVYNVVLFYSYHDGEVQVASSTLKKYIRVNTEGRVDKVVASLKAKGFIDTDNGIDEKTGHKTRSFILVRERIPAGFGKPLRKVVQLQIND